MANAERSGAAGPSPFRALRHRDFRLYVGGMIVSVVGSWMQQTAQSWLVYRLTRSEWMLGLTWFCANIPVLLLAPLAGGVADRVSRHRLVLCTQVGAMLQAAVLATLTLSGVVRPGHILVLALCLGVVNAFDLPGRQSLYVHLVEKEDLISAIALNSATFNTARIAGPAIAGIVVAAAGEGVCFAWNAVSYLAVMAALLAMRLHEPARAAGASLSLRAGFERAWRDRPLRWILLTAGAVSFAAAPGSALAPIFADAIFHRGARGLGFLTSAVGVGAVIGVLTLARHSAVARLPRVVLRAALLMAAALTVFALSPSYWVTLAVMPFLGMAIMRLNAGAQTLVQTSVEDAFRGRIMGIYSMMFLGLFPVGSLVAGAAASVIGARWTTALGGLLCLAAALQFAARRERVEAWVRERGA